MATVVTYHPDVSPADALWALYQSQSKKVRKAFRMRLLAEDISDKEETDMLAYEQQLPESERQAAHALAKAVRQGVDDVKKATFNRTHAGRLAEDFLAELEQE